MNFLHDDYPYFSERTKNQMGIDLDDAATKIQAQAKRILNMLKEEGVYKKTGQRFTIEHLHRNSRGFSDVLIFQYMGGARSRVYALVGLGIDDSNRNLICWASDTREKKALQKVNDILGTSEHLAFRSVDSNASCLAAVNCGIEGWHMLTPSFQFDPRDKSLQYALNWEDPDASR